MIKTKKSEKEKTEPVTKLPRKNKSVKDETVNLKKVKTYSIEFSSQELVHLRDLFSIFLPPEGQLTVSQALASSQNRPLTEGKLYNKIVQSCTKAKIPVLNESPDFIIAPTAPQPLSVFNISPEYEE